jgi:oligopeptide/dipeptide ABC transporter ATP-binding protein
VTPPLLELRDVSVRFRNRRHELTALDHVSLNVRIGSSVGLVGESGSGKSTIARVALGLVPVSSGQVMFDGRDITGAGFKARRMIYRDMQIVFQDPFSSLNPDRTVGATLAEPLESFGVDSRSEVRRRVAGILERVHLPVDSLVRFPHELSGGQRQRVAIARALILEPRLVICDEAVSALDLSVQAQILDLLKELQERLGLSYLFISHDLEVVQHMCDETVVLYRGRVMESGQTAELAEAPAHPYTESLQRAAPLPNPRLQRQRRGALRPAGAVTPVQDSSSGCVFAPRCAYSVTSCWQQPPQLRAVGPVRVACDRFPAWRAESKSLSNGGSDSAYESQLPEVR